MKRIVDVSEDMNPQRLFHADFSETHSSHTTDLDTGFSKRRQYQDPTKLLAFYDRDSLPSPRLLISSRIFEAFS